MPKPMEMTIEVEEIAFGPVFRKLDIMPGVIAIHLRGTGPRAVGPRNRGSVATVECLVLGALMLAKKPLNTTELATAITSFGKQKSSLGDSLMKLKAKKHIAAVKTATYKITPAGVDRYRTACVLATAKPPKKGK
jgi:hypothetical protein